MHHLSSHAVAGVSHVKWRKMGRDVSSGPAFLSKKRGRLAADVSSGLIFLKKNEKKRKEERKKNPQNPGKLKLNAY